MVGSNKPMLCSITKLLHHDEYEKEKEMVEEIPQGRPENTHKHKHSHHTTCIGIRQCVACDLMSPLRDFSTSLHKFL